MTKYLITGGDSNLATYLAKLLTHQAIVLKKRQCDITSETSIKKTFKKYQFQFLINCAAVTDIEFCELDPMLCLNVNTIGPYLLNKYCRLFHKKLINISSDYAHKPLNIYGFSKYFSEKIIDKNNLSIRTNFYSPKTYIIKNVMANSKFNAYTNVYFNPVSINRLAAEVIRRQNKSGVINILTDKKISYYHFAQKVCQVFDVNSDIVVKTKYVFDHNQADRPLSSYLKPSLRISLERDIKNFRKYIHN